MSAISNVNSVEKASPELDLMSYRFDEESNQIVARIKVGEGEFGVLNIDAETVTRMADWIQQSKALASLKSRKNSRNLF